MDGIIFPKLGPAEEAEAVKSTEKESDAEQRKDGDKVYLISTSWFDQWCNYTGFTINPSTRRVNIVQPKEAGPRPGPIDNSDILSDEPPKGSDFTPDEQQEAATLRPEAMEKKDFVCVSEPTFKLLMEWYSLEGLAVAREYMAYTAANALELDIHQWHFKVMVEGEEESGVVIASSERMSLRNLKRRACKAAGVEESQYLLFNYDGFTIGQNLDDVVPLKTVSAAHLSDQQALLLRPKEKVEAAAQPPEAEAGPSAALPLVPLALPAPSTSPGALGSPMAFGSPTSPLSRSVSNPPSWAEDTISAEPQQPRGLAGLTNVGNTCFMASALQCLAHTPAVLDVFLSGRYRGDLNTENPLGLGGKLAEAFASLLEKLWSGGVASVRPDGFKWRLSRFAPFFRGYSQQDSQELLIFLLDGLHEDLNRVREKPFIELKDSGDRPDAELAAEALAAYRARNDSVIVDAFMGMYRSLLTCPECGFQSRKMEPVMYFSVPLPASRSRTISLTVVRMDGSQPPLQYAVTIPKSGTVRDVLGAVAQAAGVAGPGQPPPEELVLLGVSSFSKLDFFRDPATPASAIKEPRSSFMGSSASTSGRVLAYVYPDSKAGRREVQVSHKAGYRDLMPPTVLYLTQEEVQALQAELEASDSAGAAGQLPPDSVLEERLKQMLRPCLKPQLPLPQPSQAVGPGEPAAAAAAEGDGMQQDAAEAESSGEMELDAEQEDDNSKPFDMFARQQEQQQQQQQQLAVDGAPPFRLKHAQPGYMPSNSSSLTEGTEALRFTADWDTSQLGAWYDRALWECPGADASELRAREERRNPAKVTLADCLKAYLEPERLDPDNSWYCSKCKEHVQADKKLDFWSLPDVLIVHLVRFTNSRFSREKLDTPVEFPLEGLDMAPYLLDQQQALQQAQQAAGQEGPGPTHYDLFAVSNHYGGLGGGHYTAYAKMQDSGQWYCFDDSHVRRVDPEQVQSPAAYVLFYLRRGAAQPSLDSLPSALTANESTLEALADDELPDMDIS